MKTLLLVLAIISSNVFACGGGAITEKEVLAHARTQKAQKELEAAIGEELVLNVVKMSGNEILDINMEVVARARCAANYVSIYYKAKNDSRIFCHAAGEVNSENEFYLSAGKCRLASGQLTEWIYFK